MYAHINFKQILMQDKKKNQFLDKEINCQNSVAQLKGLF